MDPTNLRIIESLPDYLRHIAGHIHRAEFDDSSRRAVEEYSTSFVRAFDLLGSGLLQADAPSFVPNVTSNLCELSRSDVVSKSFPWTRVSSAHLASCASQFARLALGEKTKLRVPDSEYADACAVVLLQTHDSCYLSEDDLAHLFWLAKLLRLLPSTQDVAMKLESAIEHLFSVNSQNSAVHHESVGFRRVLSDAWQGDALFNLARAQIVLSVDAGPELQSTCSLCNAVAGGDLAVCHASQEPAKATAIALILCRSVQEEHRLAGLAAVRALALSGQERHFDACIEAIRESIVLISGTVLVRAVSCLRLLFISIPTLQSSLTSPDSRCAGAAEILFESFADSSDRGGQSATAVCYSFADAMEVVNVSLFRRIDSFVRLFSSLFVRLAQGLIPSKLETRGDTEEFGFDDFPETRPDVFESLCVAFETAAEIVWPRLGEHRKAMIEACITAVCEASTRRKKDVFSASIRILRALLRCNGAARTIAVLRELGRNAKEYPSLKSVELLIAQVLSDTSVKQRNHETVSETGKQFGAIVQKYV